MAGFEQYLLDGNGDGFFDDASVRFVVDLDDEVDERAFWRSAIDLAALIGLESQALPLPLFLPEGVESDGSVVYLRNASDIDSLIASVDQAEDIAGQAAEASTPSGDLLELFTLRGLLADVDGDLLPDGTSFGLELPDEMSPGLGAALCNLAVRIGLESGGVTLPMVSSAGRALSIRNAEIPARLSATSDGWLAEGDPESLAGLLNEISLHWPHFGQPETAGARHGVDWFARLIAGEDADRRDDTAMRWEMQWSAQPESERLIEAVERVLLPRLDTDAQLSLTVFACEPLPVRKQLEQALQSRIEACGVANPDIRVLSAFKTGLSWLTEVVLPELENEPVTLLEISYRRFESQGEQSHLDLPIRWLQELFPGDEIAADRLGISLDDIVLIEDESPDAPTYRATARDADGQSIGSWECDLLSYTMPFMPNVKDSEHVTVTTGGFIATIDGERLAVPVDTDLDRFWRFWQSEVLARIVRETREAGGFHAGRQPFFGALEAEVWLSTPNNRLGIREENDSAAEALHEDIYFNTLDTIEVRGLDSSGDKTSAPGAVIPIIHVQPGVAPHAVVRLFEAPAPRPEPPKIRVQELTLDDGELVAGLDIDMSDLPAEVRQPLTSFLADAETRANSFAARLPVSGEGVPLRLPLPEMLPSDGSDDVPPMDENLYGDAVGVWSGRVSRSELVTAWIEDQSYQGRPIPALALHTAAPGRVWSPAKLAVLKPTVLIAARHHANEISSTNAAFRLAHLVGQDMDWSDLVTRMNIVVIPYENADGAALHARLAAVPGAGTWKHHPARYNALGYEFSEDFHNLETVFGESRVRPALWRRWLPDVLVDNHGVPSHEWVQPFAGFGSPPRFRVSYWIPQALVYGIVRHVEHPDHPEHKRAATALRDAVSAAVREGDIGDLNREIGASYRKWAQSRVPEHFPGDFHDDMLWHIGGTPPDPKGRGFNLRYPRTTVLSWVTEVNDETATGKHLEMVSRAHLTANRAMLDLLAAAETDAERRSVSADGGRVTRRFGRSRPLRIG